MTYIIIIIISLVNSALSVSDYITSDVRISDKRILSWQDVEGRDCGLIWGGPLSWHLRRRTWKELWKSSEGYLVSRPRYEPHLPNFRRSVGIATFRLLLLTLLLLPPLPLLLIPLKPLLQDHYNSKKTAFFQYPNNRKTYLFAQKLMPNNNHEGHQVHITCSSPKTNCNFVFIRSTSLKEPQKMSVSSDLWRRTKWPVSSATHTRRRRSCNRKKNTPVSISKSVTNQQTQVQGMKHNSQR